MRSRKCEKLRREPRLRAGLLAFALTVAALAAPVLPAQAGEWKAHDSRAHTLSGKMNSLQKDINELIHHKRETENTDEIKAIIGQMNTKYDELKKAAAEYEEERLHMRFKHPEKGDATERKYTRFQLKTLEEMENDVGLEGRLDRVKRKMQVQYGVKKSEGEEQDREERKPASAQDPTERITLRK